MKKIIFGLIAICGLGVLFVGCLDRGCCQEPAAQQAPGYTPQFGLDPIGQSIVRSREESLSLERRIHLLERQVAQLQRIVFRDPTIRAPHPAPPAVPVPDPIPDGEFPFGSAGPDDGGSDDSQ